MALLDLQSMETPEPSAGGGGGNKSAASKGCAPSFLSVALC
jgi:hypothetical protein